MSKGEPKSTARVFGKKDAQQLYLVKESCFRCLFSWLLTDDMKLLIEFLNIGTIKLNQDFDIFNIV